MAYRLHPSSILACLACLGIASMLDADLAMAAGASAPIDPGYNWSGFYLGLNVGAGWNRDRGPASCVDNFGVLNGPDCQVLPAGTTGAVSAAGVVAGGQLGYNWQYGRMVLGLEADFEGSGISGTSNVNGPFGFAVSAGPGDVALPAGAYTATEKLDWFGTLRGRLGYAALDRALIYVTGGLAYGHISASTNFTAPNVGTIYPGDTSTTNIGWTVGGGVEYAFTDDLSARVEGLYYDLGTATVIGNEIPPTFTPFPFQHNKTFDANGAIFRVGLNYRFSGPIVGH
jgi:outer membrane immunogenic protein